MLILFILVLQFNSISKPVIILTEIIFSVIGVLLGFAFTGMTISAVMTGLGIVGLAGIVVKNGILVIEFADELRERGMKTREALIQAGKTRIIPVLLTALAAILALIPLAIGFNINFVTLFADLNPHIFFGGDSAVFWKPLVLDNHIRTCICILHDTVYPAEHVPDCRKVEETDAPVFRRQMDFHDGHSSAYIYFPDHHDSDIRWSGIPLKKPGERRNLAGQGASETWIGSWF